MNLKKAEPFLKIILSIAIILAGIEVINYFGQFQRPLKYAGIIGFAIVLYGFTLGLPQLMVIIVSIYFLIYRKIISGKTEEENSNTNNREIENTESNEDEIEGDENDETAEEDDFKIDEEQITKRKRERRFNIILLTMLILGWLAVVIEIKPNDNTLNGFDLFLKSVFSGLFTGLIAFFIWVKFFVKNAINFTQGLNMFLFLPLFTASIFYAGGNFTNRTFAGEKKYSQLMVIKKTINERYNNRYVFVDVNGTEERLETSVAFYDSVTPGKPVRLSLKPGLFGYDVVVWDK